MAKFKKTILEAIKSDADLFAKVAKEMGINPMSLSSSLHRNGNSLNRFSVVKLVADHLGKLPEEVVEEITEAQN